MNISKITSICSLRNLYKVAAVSRLLDNLPLGQLCFLDNLTASQSADCLELFIKLQHVTRYYCVRGTILLFIFLFAYGPIITYNFLRVGGICHSACGLRIYKLEHTKGMFLYISQSSKLFSIFPGANAVEFERGVVGTLCAANKGSKLITVLPLDSNII